MNPFEMLIHFTIGLPVIMAVSLLLRPLYLRNVVLSLFLLELGYFHFCEYLIYTTEIVRYPHFFFIHTPMAANIGALLYLYVQSITHDKKNLKPVEYLHFLPTLAIVLLLIPYYFLPTAEKSRLVYDVIYRYQNPYIYAVTFFSIAVLVTYIVLAIIHIVRSFKIKNRTHARITGLLVLLITILLNSFIEVVNIVDLEMDFFRITIIGICVEFICIILFLMRYPHLMLHVTVPSKRKTPARSHLGNVDIDELDVQLTLLMVEEKFFCDEDLSLGRLSDALEITPHQLSEFLNEHYKKNFNSYVNGYRVEEAKKLLVAEPGRNTLSIAFAVGFNSYSAFHRVFKKETGSTPAEYRKRQADAPHNL